jgi:glycosyltransferase involved in cell wall biosynthesis
MYNERRNIEQVLAQAETVIPELGFSDYEILIIDDGSRDGCDALVEAQAQCHPHIRLVRHPQNMGYGVALRTGFTEADREAVFYTDCDLPADLRDLARALPLLQEADLVIGYRVKRYETLRRAIYSRIYNLLMRLLFGVHVRDVNFSFKLVRGEVLDAICLSAKTVFIDGQLLAEAVRHGYKIAEIPIEYTPRKFGRSNFDSLKTAWATLTEMVGYWLNGVEASVTGAPAISRERVPAIASVQREEVL